MKTILTLLITFTITLASGQKIYRDVTKSKEAIIESNYDKLYFADSGESFTFGYTTDGKYGVENVLYYVNESGYIYKVIYIAEHAKDGYMRYLDMVKKLSAKEFMNMDQYTKTAYAYGSSYYDGWALFKYGDKNIDGINVSCLTVILDKRPQ